MSITKLTTNGLTGTKYDTVSADNYYMEPIATTLISSATGTVTFSNIPQNYKHLQVRAFGKSTTTNDQDLYWRYNGDTSASYSIHYLLGNGVGAFSAGAANNTFIRANSVLVRSTYTSVYGASIIDILDYANVNKNKTSRHFSGSENNTSGQAILDSGCWYNTAPITSILFYPGSGNFEANTRVSLYGIKG